MTSDKLTRRTLGGLAAAGVGVPLLAACSSSDSSSTATDPGSGATSPSSATPTASSSDSASSAGGGGQKLTTTSDVKVGGGTIFADQEVVVTQPTAGDFKCFTAICTHQGCVVSDVSGGTINCACHGSQYSIEDGSVVQGPATFPLAAEKITVTGSDISLA